MSGKKTSEAEKTHQRRKKTPEAEKTIKRREKSFRISANISNIRVISMIGKKAVLYTPAALHSAGLKTTNCESNDLHIYEIKETQQCPETSYQNMG